MHDPIPNLDGGSQKLNWGFVGSMRLTGISTNDVYHNLIDKNKWIEEKVIYVWGLHKPITW